jgi:Tfp pilus assembly protein PilO
MQKLFHTHSWSLKPELLFFSFLFLAILGYKNLANFSPEMAKLGEFTLEEQTFPKKILSFWQEEKKNSSQDISCTRKQAGFG